MKTSTTDHHDNHHKNLGPLTLTVEADLKVTNMSYFNNNNNNKNNKNDNNLHYSAACKVGVRDVVSQVSVQDIAVLMSIIKSLNKNNNNNKNINKNSTFENNDNSSLNGRINNCNDNDNNNNNKNNNNNSDVDADGDEKGIYYEDDLKSKEFKIVEGNNGLIFIIIFVITIDIYYNHLLRYILCIFHIIIIIILLLYSPCYRCINRNLYLSDIKVNFFIIFIGLIPLYSTMFLTLYFIFLEHRH